MFVTIEPIEIKNKPERARTKEFLLKSNNVAFESNSPKINTIVKIIPKKIKIAPTNWQSWPINDALFFALMNSLSKSKLLEYS